MKHIIFVCLIFLVPASLLAQLGDFNLPQQNNRPYVTVVADSQMKGGLFKNIFIGKNYSREWLQPIRVPVLNMSADYGLKAVELGGGKQTKSLEVKDAQGREWVLRSVKKNPDKVVPPEVKGTIGEKIVRSSLSGSYPYAVLSTGTLAKAANVPYLKNTLVFVGDDPALGEFREKYKNTLAFFEQRTVMDANGKEAETSNTDDLVFELNKSADKKVDQRMVLRARLLDNFIMDFDRHEDQWVWVEKDSGGRKIYHPVPKDRDQSFYKLSGLLKLATLNAALGPVQGFKAEARNIKTFNNSAKDFDRRFLTEPDEKMWMEEVDQLLAAMTDGVIEEALSRQPKEIQNFSAKNIISTLKERRRYFKEEMLEYYQYLSKMVSVTGSNDAEQFTLTQNPDGSVLVVVHKMENGSPAGENYRRLFDPAVTKEIRLYGFENDDKFLVQGGNSPIKIRMVGGPGNDNFVNEGTGGNLIAYDISTEKNSVSGKIDNKISDDPMNNEYRQRGHVADVSTLGLFGELSGGLLIGPSLKIITQGFRKEPYGSKHLLYALRAINGSFYHFKYDADFIGKKTDLLLRSDFRVPTIRTNFFGIGNNTTYNSDIPETNFRAHYSLLDAALLLNRKVSSNFNIQLGPVLQYFKLDENQNTGKHVRALYPDNSSNASLYDGMWYGGAELRAEVNARNNDLLPTSGFKTSLFVRPLYGFENSNSVTQTGGELAFYTDFLAKNKIVLATAFGASHTAGDFEFVQAQYLGLRQNLRAHRFQRFAGRSRAYNNTDLRIGLGDVNLYFVKGPFGLIGFHDIARVWADGENSDTWHKGYGGGIWMSPFTKFVVVGTMGFSKEEKMLPQITFGFQF